MKLHKAYLFRGKEPAIDEMRTLLEDHFGEKISRKMLKKIEESGGASAGCTGGWFFGPTRRPRNETLEATGRSIGWKRQWVKMK